MILNPAIEHFVLPPAVVANEAKNPIQRTMTGQMTPQMTPLRRAIQTFLSGLALTVMIALCAAQLQAQGFSGLARVDAQNSTITDQRGDRATLSLGLSQGVPYRVFTLAEPPRVVLDFQEVDWKGLVAETFDQSEKVTDLRYGTYVPGWSRMVLTLSEPMGLDQVGLTQDETTGAARLEVTLKPENADDFAQNAGAPYDPRWDLPRPTPLSHAVTRAPDAPLRVVLDPGHGGVDPGAQTEQVNEKFLMLTFARELRETLLRSGEFEVILTRDDDSFVSLERRIALAHQAGADVFLSLHADALAEGLAHGATVYVLAPEASDAASRKLAERHDRDNLLAGADLSKTDDEVTDVLLDLARQETQPRTETLAHALISGMTQQGGPMNRRPLRRAGFSVLKAADIPSALIEIGFMSSPRDLENLLDPAWRQKMAAGIRDGLLSWRADDAARRPLVRQ